MRLGIFARTFAGNDPETVLAAARRAGYSAVQYNMACSGVGAMPDELEPEVAERAGAAARAAGVEMAALSGTYNMIHPDAAVREQGHRRLEVLARCCAALGTRLITLCTGTRDAEDQWRAHRENELPEAWADLTVSMERAIGIAERYDVELGIEPELANVINSAAKARRLMDEMQSARLKVVMDPANLFERATLKAQRDAVRAAIELLADRIAMGHAKDRTAEGGFTAAGQGVLDYAHYLSCLRAIGFDGPLVTHGLSAAEAPGVAKFLRETLEGAGIAVQG